MMSKKVEASARIANEESSSTGLGLKLGGVGMLVIVVFILEVASKKKQTSGVNSLESLNVDNTKADDTLSAPRPSMFSNLRDSMLQY